VSRIVAAIRRHAVGPSLVTAVILVVVAGATVAARAARGTAPLAYVANAGEIVPLPQHRLLITDIGGLDRVGGQVLITDFADRLIWKYAGHLDLPHSAYPMPNGDILIADTGDNRVIEVNQDSRIIWNTDFLGRGHGRLGQGTLSDGTTLAYPNDAKPLPNGDVLISCRLQDRVVEITPAGRVVQNIHGFLNRQHNPDRIPNGDTLIADSGSDRVIEVGHKGKHVLWSFGGRRNGAYVLDWPRDVNLLPNGHLLITDSDHDRLIEVTRSKRIVHQWVNLPRPYSAASLPSGDILVGDGATLGVVKLNRQDHILWHLNHRGPPTRPPSRRVRNGGFEHTIAGSKKILRFWQRNDALAYSVPAGKRAAMVRDAHVHHGGRYSGRITYHGDSNGLFFGQTVRVDPGHRYRFTGWIRTHNIKACTPCRYGPGSPAGHTAEFELVFNSRTGPAPPAPALPQYSGTQGWQRNAVVLTIPAHVHSLSIQCELRGQGTVWFDDVWLQRLS